MTEIVSALDFESRQLTIWIFIGVAGVVALFFVAIFIMSLRAKSKYENESLPTLSEMGLADEDETKPEDEDENTSMFTLDDDDIPLPEPVSNVDEHAGNSGSKSGGSRGGLFKKSR